MPKHLGALPPATQGVVFNQGSTPDRLWYSYSTGAVQSQFTDDTGPTVCSARRFFSLKPTPSLEPGSPAWKASDVTTRPTAPTMQHIKILA